MKIVREHYLRDDIWCGSKACTQCDTTKSSNEVLNDLPGSVSSLCDFNHYIILDTNAVLHQVCNFFCDSLSLYLYIFLNFLKKNFKLYCQLFHVYNLYQRLCLKYRKKVYISNYNCICYILFTYFRWMCLKTQYFKMLFCFKLFYRR